MKSRLDFEMVYGYMEMGFGFELMLHMVQLWMDRGIFIFNIENEDFGKNQVKHR